MNIPVVRSIDIPTETRPHVSCWNRTNADVVIFTFNFALELLLLFFLGLRERSSETLAMFERRETFFLKGINEEGEKRSDLKITAKCVWTLAGSYSELADIRSIVQFGNHIKCSPTLKHSVKLEFGKVLSLLKFIVMTSILA